MKTTLFFSSLLVFITGTYICAAQTSYNTSDFAITGAKVTHNTEMQLTVWEITVKGNAGATVPKPAGMLDGAPVLGYVFPTSLPATAVGFNATEGIVSLALTSHPDFDDTPLWDENNDAAFDNDGIIWHPHWVLLIPDKRVNGGLAVKEFTKDDSSVRLPPTNPEMPMYMDSPGYSVITKGNSIKVIIPDYRIKGKTSFSFDGVAAYMQVNTSIPDKPLLGVYDVFSIASGDLSLPYTVE